MTIPIITKIFRPIGAGDETNLYLSGAPTNWQVTGRTTPSLIINLSSSISGYQRDLYQVTSNDIMDCFTIMSVVTSAVMCTNYPAPTAKAKFALKINGTVYESPEISIPTDPSYTLVTYNYTWDINPETEVSWQPTDFDSIQLGMSLQGVPPNSAILNQEYMTVEYTKHVTLPPSDILTYFPSRDYYSIAWKVNPVVQEDLDLLSCEIHIDTSPNFDTINLKTYTGTSSEVDNFQDGYFFKSVSFYRRDLFEDVTYYVRVRVSNESYLSEWSETSTFVLPKNTWYDDTRLLKALLPTDTVYTKEGITVSGKIIEAYARETADLKKETTQVANNVNYYKCQDEDLFNNLGILLGIYRNTSRPFIEYKRELLEFWESFLQSGTEGAIKKVIKAILGMECDIVKVKDTYGWIVHDTQNLPYVPPLLPHETNSAHFYLPDPLYPTLTPTPCPNSRTAKGLSLILRIYNPFLISSRKTLVEKLITALKPVNVTIYFEWFQYGGMGTAGWGDGYWGNGGYWGQQNVNWVQYTPSDTYKNMITNNSFEYPMGVGFNGDDNLYDAFYGVVFTTEQSYDGQYSARFRLPDFSPSSYSAYIAVDTDSYGVHYEFGLDWTDSEVWHTFDTSTYAIAIPSFLEANINKICKLRIGLISVGDGKYIHLDQTASSAWECLSDIKFKYMLRVVDGHPTVYIDNIEGGGVYQLP